MEQAKLVKIQRIAILVHVCCCTCGIPKLCLKSKIVFKIALFIVWLTGYMQQTLNLEISGSSHTIYLWPEFLQVIIIGDRAVSYTHLTLPTKLEV